MLAGDTQPGGVDSAALLESIETQESGGNPTATNARTGAYGRYQIMPSNWEPWSREVFGEVVERTPENQEAIARHVMSRYEREFGPEGAAVAWYAGPSRARQWVENPDDPWFDRRHGGGQEPSVREYVQSVMGRVQEEAPQQEVMSEQDLRAMLSGGAQEAAPPQDQRALGRATMERMGQRAPVPERLRRQMEAAGIPVENMEAGGRRSMVGEIGAAAQGIGSGLFGVGTPITAAFQYLASRVDPRRESLSWHDATERARGIREGAARAFPTEYYTGMASSVVGSSAGATRLLSKAPAAVQSVARVTQAPAGERLSRGARAANVARLSGTGAVAAGVTGGLEEGADAVVPSAAVGAGAGAALPLAARAGSALVRGVRRLFSKDNAAIRELARIVKRNPDELTEEANRFIELHGRAPRLVEIAGEEAAERMGLVSASGVGSRAGAVFRQAAEDAAVTRQTELSSAVRRGGATTTEEAARAPLAGMQREAAESLTGPRTTEVAAREALTETTDEAGRVVRSRSGATPEEIIGHRDVEMDRVLSEIGDHQIPVSDEMLQVLQHPDVYGTLDSALRRSLNRIIEQGVEAGAVTIPIRTWDMVRRSLNSRSNSPAYALYAGNRNKITEYVNEAAPEYGQALREYGEQSDVARGVVLGMSALRDRSSRFASKLRTAGGGTEDVARRASTRVNEQQGALMGARTALVDALSGPPEEAQRFMTRLARDSRLQRNLRAALSPEEFAELESLGAQYGQRLGVAEGVAAGQRLATRGDEESLAAALRGDREAAGQGVRATLADALGASSDSAENLMQRLSNSPAFLNRVSQVLTDEEAAALQRIARSYGVQLDFAEGAARGRQVMTQRTEPFVDAAEGLAEPGREGLRRGARGAVADAALESPDDATRTAIRLAESEGLHTRLTAALGGEEAARLREVGQSATEAARNLGRAAPRVSEAQAQAQANARDLQDIIAGGVILYGRASGALIANVGNRLIQRLRLSKGAATRLAEMAVDPENVHIVIERLRRAGMSQEEIVRMYQEAAVAAGILTGSGSN